MTTPQPIIRNQGNTGSFFAAQQESPTGNQLIGQQVDPTQPRIQGLKRVSGPIQPAKNAKFYTQNFDPDLYDLRDTSHLMRLIRAFAGAAGIGGIQKQTLIARLAGSLMDGSFLDLDKFYGAIFGLQRHSTESMPINIDGTTVNPYTDLANSDIWDDAISRDAKFRSHLFQLAHAVNMGATVPGLKGAAQAILNCDVDIIESWVKADFYNGNSNLQPSSAMTYYGIANQLVTFGNMGVSYGTLQGTQFGDGVLPAGNRGELIFTPRRSITLEERYQLVHVLNTLKPSNVQITIADPIVEGYSNVPARSLSADSENWQIQARVTPALDLIDAPISIYSNAGPYSQARPVFSEYSGEQWSYNPNVVRAASYRISGGSQSTVSDEQRITYSDGASHTYSATDGVNDVRHAISHRLSGEGAVTNMPYSGERINYSNSDGLT